MIGRSLGRFRIVASLGTGGMASVWRARDELLGRDLALKILSDSLAESEDARRRFRHEAHIAAALDHPAIAAVYDSGETDGATWIAMALIDGETLAERLARSLVPVAQLVSISTVVADALGFAHGHGVVHRDVTARNVMLGRDGRVFVLDFGLALAQGASRISTSGTTVGTAPYMAPELLLGATANPRSDLYGLGVVMYEALTGALPFASGARPAAAIFSVLNDAVRPPRQWRPEIPPALEAIVMRCLARDPGERFGDAGELAAALREVAGSLRGGEAEPASRTPLPGAPADGSPASDAMTAPLTRSTIAERLADRSSPVYLAIPAFECQADADVAAETGAIARGIARAAAATLTRLQRMHVVPAEVDLPGHSSEALRAYARALGAQLLVLGEVRRVGTRLRITYMVCDPEASLQIAGDSLEGSSLDPFELEDRVLKSLKRVFARDRVDSEAVTRALPRDPAAAEHFQQAQRYMERHDHEASVDGAIAILERLVASEGDVASYQAALARASLFKYALTRQRNWEARAAAAAAKAAEIAPDAAETFLALAEIHRASGRFADAEREYDLALAQRPDDYEAALGRARALQALGRVSEATTALTELTARRPGDWRAFKFLGALYFYHGDYERALATLTRVVELLPDSAQAASDRGTALYRVDRLEEALAEYRHSLELQPNPLAFTNLGTILFYLERHEEAVTAFEKAVALTPSRSDAWGNLGNALHHAGSPERARQALERAAGLAREQLGRNPEDAETWARLAGWQTNLAETALARRSLDEALKRGSADAHCLVRAAHVKLQWGESEEAVDLLSRAVKAGYGIEELRRDPELKSLAGHARFDSLMRRPHSSGPQSTEVG